MYQSLWSRCPSILNKPMLPWVLWQLMRRQTRAGNAIPQNVREWGTVPYTKNKERGSREIRDNRNLTHEQFLDVKVLMIPHSARVLKPFKCTFCTNSPVPSGYGSKPSYSIYSGCYVKIGDVSWMLNSKFLWKIRRGGVSQLQVGLLTP